MRNVSLLLLYAVFFLLSCVGGNKNITPNGYQLTPYTTSKGEKPAVGDLAFVNLYFYMDGKLQSSTRQNDRIMPVKIYSLEELRQMKESGKANPIYEAIAMMSVGDSLRVDVPITEEMRQDQRMTSAQEMYYDIVMVEAKTQEAFKADQQADRDRRAKLAEESKEKTPEIAAKVAEIATKYRKGQFKDQLTTTNTGLKYLILEEGGGPAVQLGTKVDVHYYGVLTNGEMFDNSYQRGSPYNFPVGAGRVIKGWDEGVALLKKGDHAALFIPSELGYGKAGSGEKIPGDSELIFYIEVL